MSYFLPGARTVSSTDTTATNPTTTTIICYVTSTGASTAGGLGMEYESDVLVNAYLGTSTQATVWWVDHALSSGLGSTAIKDQTRLVTASGQTSQFQLRYRLAKGDLIRVRVSAAFTGTADAKLKVEVIG
jgi:hypothetical protein